MIAQELSTLSLNTVLIYGTVSCMLKLSLKINYIILINFLTFYIEIKVSSLLHKLSVCVCVRACMCACVFSCVCVCVHVHHCYIVGYFVSFYFSMSPYKV